MVKVPGAAGWLRCTEQKTGPTAKAERADALLHATLFFLSNQLPTEPVPKDEALHTRMGYAHLYFKFAAAIA